jgi:hypothetical protein
VRRVKLGDIEFDVIESENPKDSVTVTDKSVESGQDVSDHVKQNPSIINLRGQMTEDAVDKLQVLKKYQKEGTLLKYVGRNVYPNMVIEEIDREHGTRNRLGFQFNIKLKQVRIATAKEVEINMASPKDATKVKPIANKGKQQPKQKRLADNQTKVMNHVMVGMMMR